MNDTSVKNADSPFSRRINRRELIKRGAAVGLAAAAAGGAITFTEQGDNSELAAINEIAAALLTKDSDGNLTGTQFFQGLPKDVTGRPYIRMHVGVYEYDSGSNTPLHEAAFINPDLHYQYFPLAARPTRESVPIDSLEQLAAHALSELLEAQRVNISQITLAKTPDEADLFIMAADLRSVREQSGSGGYTEQETLENDRRTVVGLPTQAIINGATKALVVVDIEDVLPRLLNPAVDVLLPQQFAGAMQAAVFGQKELGRINADTLSKEAQDYLAEIQGSPGKGSVTELMSPIIDVPYRDVQGELNAPVYVSPIDKAASSAVKQSIKALPAGPSR